jgi:hypothetical protein
MTLDTVFGDGLLECPKSHGIVKYPLKSFILMCLLKYAVFYTSENWINIESTIYHTRGGLKEIVFNLL